MANKDKVPSKTNQQRYVPYSKTKPSQTSKSFSKELLTSAETRSTGNIDACEGEGTSSFHKAYPCISARQPYAGLILNGLKTIETRWTSVFEKLEGSTVAIHVAWKDWDGEEWRNVLQMDYRDEEIEEFIRDGEQHGRAVVAGLVDVGETWQCPGVGEKEQITEWEKCALLRPLHEKFLTKLSNPRWFKRPLQVRGQKGIWEVNIPQGCF